MYIYNTTYITLNIFYINIFILILTFYINYKLHIPFKKLVNNNFSFESSKFSEKLKR